MDLTGVWNGVPASLRGVPTSAAIWRAASSRNSLSARMAWTGLKVKGSGRTRTMSRRQATLFSLIGEMTALSTMWELWRNARMERSTPWRAILEMPVSSRAIQSGAAQYTVTECLPIKIGQKKNRGAYSSVSSFALHSPFTVASITESSLSSNQLDFASKRLRTELF